MDPDGSFPDGSFPDGSFPDGKFPDGVEVRVVQPFEARKEYLCPGCQHEIPARLGHLVVVPVGAADLRRHWHKACWANRINRRPGRDQRGR